MLKEDIKLFKDWIIWMKLKKQFKNKWTNLIIL
jgi:hypothetical protein